MHRSGRNRGIGGSDGNRGCLPLIGSCLRLVEDAAKEPQVALLVSHLLVASRPDFLGNTASFELSPRIRFIATAFILDGLAALCEFGAATRRVIVRHLCQGRHSNARGSDSEKRSDHCGPPLPNTDFAFVYRQCSA
jgi:hypothetical protein